jgi:uncharacterized protein
MEFSLDDIIVGDNPEASRFEATLDGTLMAVAQYERTTGRITFTHTIVAEAAEGHGVGGKLVKFALDQARTDNLVVVPLCPFVQSYLRRHPEYRDLVE